VKGEGGWEKTDYGSTMSRRQQISERWEDNKKRKVGRKDCDNASWTVEITKTHLTGGKKRNRASKDSNLRGGKPQPKKKGRGGKPHSAKKMGEESNPK